MTSRQTQPNLKSLIFSIADFHSEPFMGINLLVTERGQVTLPAALRAKLGIKPGDVVIAKEKDGGLLLQAARVVPFREYTDKEIKGWLKDDAMTPAQIEAWEKAIKKMKRKKMPVK